jgi:hypothetical protein
MDVREWMIEERRYLLSGGDGDGDIHMSGWIEGAKSGIFLHGVVPSPA